jgi:hypothetical protein
VRVIAPMRWRVSREIVVLVELEAAVLARRRSP